ncbi:MAG TPA: hypothetical protein VKK79_12075, partial [Candidatus Lokiarchaeia archaeon]|nr:hypothetical protein [Candidatus Lokiarchaeia archaeon]
MSEQFVPLVTTGPLPFNILLAVQPNRPGEEVLGILADISVRPYGVCDGCSRPNCDNCGGGNLIGTLTFNTLNDEKFVVRAWIQQIAPLARYSRTEMIHAWRAFPNEVQSRLDAYRGRPFLL